MKYRYRVEKIMYPYGQDDPILEHFDIVISAFNLRDATSKAANIGKELGLLLQGPY